MNLHEKYMSRCIQLAKNGLGTTYPNPMVGSVVVLNDIIIGEGWHFKAGQAHAEVLAIKSVKDPTQLSEATIYVSLEPCSHFGKTPPCADLIIEKGIKNVVVGSLDPNPKVAGRGIQKLKDAGCHVTKGILSAECADLNKRFFTFFNENRPYLLLKWAETSDGFIAPEEKKTKAPVWITGSASRQFVHQLRSQEQAILVGTNTVLEDNPSLTTRDWEGPSPVRVIVDRTLKIENSAQVYDRQVKTIFITERDKANEGQLSYEQIDFSKPVPAQICEVLYKHGLQSCIVEGGAQTLQSFIDAELWDEAFVFKGTTVFKNGLRAPKLSGSLLSERSITQDTLSHYKKESH